MKRTKNNAILWLLLLPVISFSFFSCHEYMDRKGKHAWYDSTFTTWVEEDTHTVKSTVDCKYHIDTLSDDFIKRFPEFKNYTWNDKTKEAKIRLENGDSLYVHIYACNNINVTAKLTRFNNDISFHNHEYWFEQAMWIAKHFEGFDAEHLREVHNKKLYEETVDKNGIFIDLDDYSYSIIVDRFGNETDIFLAHHYR